jgi:hypothetical protein
VQHVELIVKFVSITKFVQNAQILNICSLTIPVSPVVVMNYGVIVMFANNVIQNVKNALQQLHVKNVMKISIWKDLLVELPALMENMLLAKIEHVKHVILLALNVLAQRLVQNVQQINFYLIMLVLIPAHQVTMEPVVNVSYVQLLYLIVKNAQIQQNALHVMSTFI